MMFIKTVFVLYFAAIALAAPAPQGPRSFVGKVTGSVSGLLRGIVGDARDGLGGGGLLVDDGGSGGRPRTSCLNSRPLSTSLIRPT
jgi:hypothetical protein